MRTRTGDCHRRFGRLGKASALQREAKLYQDEETSDAIACSHPLDPISWRRLLRVHTLHLARLRAASLIDEDVRSEVELIAGIERVRQRAMD